MTLSEYAESLKNQKIAVVGIGVSNLPLIELLLRHGCDVTACDMRTREQMGAEADRLETLGAKLRLGADYLEHLDHDVIFRTPGLMPFDPHLEAARASGAKITSEMEAFLSLCPCKVIAITGSDGKTTTSTIISELLKAAGWRVHLGGNIGNPLLCEIPDIGKDDIAVLELSSFQLHSMVCRPDIAVVTNITPNHLDKHRDYQDYIDAKREILLRQTADDRLILNLDDEHTPYLERFAHAHVTHFSDRQRPEEGTYLRGGVLTRVYGGAERPILPATEIRIPGEHNAGVEHRLETVRTVRGVTYINDSIGSSPTRTIAGLRAMRVKPIVIAGGYDKHIPFDELGDALCQYAKALYLTGDTAEKIRAAVTASAFYAESGLPVSMAEDFRAAVLAAAGAAQAGDIVLFSPACASFDHFKNFAERGRYFKSIVMELKETE